MRAPKLHAELTRSLGEGDVDVVEDLDVVAEEADGLQHDSCVAFRSQRLEGVLDAGSDPRCAGDALALEGEVPVALGHADGPECRGNGGGGALALDRVGVGRGIGAVVLDAVGGNGCAGPARGADRVAGCADHDRPAGNRVCREEDGNACAKRGTSLRPGWPKLKREGLREQWMLAPAGDKLHLHAFAGPLGGGAIEADAGAGVLRREADGLEAGDAIGAHLREHVRDVRVPVAHADIDRNAERLAQEAALQQGPAGERRAFGQRLVT